MYAVHFWISWMGRDEIMPPMANVKAFDKTRVESIDKFYAEHVEKAETTIDKTQGDVVMSYMKLGEMVQPLHSECNHGEWRPRFEASGFKCSFSKVNKSLRFH